MKDCGEWGEGGVEEGGVQDVEELFGANRWDAAEFDDENEKQKFIKLMVGPPAPSRKADILHIPPQGMADCVLGWEGSAR